MSIIRQKINKLLLHSLLIFLITSSTLLTTIKYSSAAEGTKTGIARTRSCNSTSGKVGGDGLHFDEIDCGDDCEFDMSNPVCQTVAISFYATVKIAIAYMNRICKTGSSTPRVLPSPLLDLVDIGKATYAAITRPADCGGTVVAAGAAYAAMIASIKTIHKQAKEVFNNTNLCGSNWTKPNPKTYDLTQKGYKGDVEEKINTAFDSYNEGGPDVFNFDNKTYREWYYNGKEYKDKPADDSDQCLDENGDPQKYYLRGRSGSHYCERFSLKRNQTTDENKRAALKKAYECCRKRSTQYACIEYDYDSIATVANNIGSAFGANTSSSKGKQHKFCKMGKLCNLNGVTFQVTSEESGRLICVQSYSLCPYNFTLEGGTKYCDYYKDGKRVNGSWQMITQDDITSGNCSNKSEIRNDDCSFNEKANKCANYCQYLTHCFITSDANYEHTSSISSPYISKACLDFIGDSQNKTTYNGGIVGNQRHFSAPIAQCVKETLENVFYNKIGHTRCLDPEEIPNNGECPSGRYDISDQYTTEFTSGYEVSTTTDSYEFRKGRQAKHQSFFSKIQDAMRLIVKLALVFSITFYGMNILTGKANIGNKKDILVYLLKIGLVMFFALGNAWQNFFFDGVYNASSEVSKIVFKVASDTNDPKRLDGCQFIGTIYRPTGEAMPSKFTYPEGKEYLALWDTLDCKIMRYLGYGPSMDYAGITSLIIASYFTGAVGLYFAFALMFFGIFFIAATIRALHIFLSSCLSIIIMVFVTPIVFPTILFEKTKEIFNNWLKELISFSLQPVILFAYIAVFIMVMDKTLMGSATFAGTPPSKKVSCQAYCVSATGVRMSNQSGSSNSLADNFNDNMGTVSGNYSGDSNNAADYLNSNNYSVSAKDFFNGANVECPKDYIKKIPMNDSVACLINVDDLGTFPGFEMLGIGLPILKNLLNGSVKAKIITITKAALMMYLLCSFIDSIPDITERLIGGTPLPKSTASAAQMFKRIAGEIEFNPSKMSVKMKGGVARDVQKRLERGLRKGAGKLGSKAMDKLRKRGNEGKSTDDAVKEGNDSVANDTNSDSASQESVSDSSASQTGTNSDSSTNSNAGNTDSNTQGSSDSSSAGKDK